MKSGLEMLEIQQNRHAYSKMENSYLKPDFKHFKAEFHKSEVLISKSGFDSPWTLIEIPESAFWILHPSRTETLSRIPQRSKSKYMPFLSNKSDYSVMLI